MHSHHLINSGLILSDYKSSKLVLSVLHLFYYKFIHLSDSSEVSHSDFAIASLLPSALGAFYRYHGSLTTPPCNEIVEWVIFDTPLEISSAQVIF